MNKNLFAQIKIPFCRFIPVLVLCALLQTFKCQNICELTKLAPTEPKIPLDYCQVYQDNACCNSLQDAQIKQAAFGYFSDRCKGRFPSIKHFFCFGCDPNQPKYTYTNTAGKKVLKVCKQFFSEKVWGEPIDQTTTKYDPCGLNVGVSPDQKIVTPSTEYPTAQDFLNAIKPVFLEEFEIELADTDCVNGRILGLNKIGLFTAFAFYLLMMLVA